jgi:hypothetical protein
MSTQKAFWAQLCAQAALLQQKGDEGDNSIASYIIYMLVMVCGTVEPYLHNNILYAL